MSDRKIFLVLFVEMCVYTKHHSHLNLMTLFIYNSKRFIFCLFYFFWFILIWFRNNFRNEQNKSAMTKVAFNLNVLICRANSVLFWHNFLTNDEIMMREKHDTNVSVLASIFIHQIDKQTDVSFSDFSLTVVCKWHKLKDGYKKERGAKNTVIIY